MENTLGLIFSYYFTNVDSYLKYKHKSFQTVLVGMYANFFYSTIFTNGFALERL